MLLLLDSLTARGKIILSLILIVTVLALCGAGYYAWQNHTSQAEKLAQATVLTAQQATDKNVLQNKLDLSKQNSEMLAIFAKQALSGRVQPATNFTVLAPSLPAAAEQVADRINAKDPTLPSAALEKTDNTIVTLNANKTPQVNYDVAVFKNNNYRNWEWSTGYGQHGGDRYIPVELQRNFSKDAAVSVEYHAGSKQSGYEVKYIRKTDKLFIIF